jgi:hypothetical protein
MSKTAKESWRAILEDYPLGPEPPYVPAFTTGLLGLAAAARGNWLKLLDAKLHALALREGTLTGDGQVDWKALVRRLALKHEAGFNSTRPRGRPRELTGATARSARKALLAHVQQAAGARKVAGQGTAILRQLASNTSRLAKIDPYYANSKRQSFAKLKKDIQQARKEAAEYQKALAAALSTSPGQYHGFIFGSQNDTPPSDKTTSGAATK